MKLTAQLATVGEDAKQAKTELAILRTALTTEGVEPLALLDSRSFMEKAATLDPADAAALTAAITEAVAANPALGKTTGPRLPMPNPAQGTGSSGAPSLDEQIAAAQKAGDTRAVISLQNQKLAAPQR